MNIQNFEMYTIRQYPLDVRNKYAGMFITSSYLSDLFIAYTYLPILHSFTSYLASCSGNKSADLSKNFSFSPYITLISVYENLRLK